jgi:hypothetical protein
VIQQQFNQLEFYNSTIGFQRYDKIRDFGDFKQYMTVTLPQTAILDSARRQEWLKFGWVVLGAGEIRVIHCELEENVSNRGKRFIDATRSKNTTKYSSMRIDAKIAEDLPPISIGKR